jgi:hypothetical protein
MIKLGDAITKYVLPELTKIVATVTKVVDWFGQLPPGTKKLIVTFGLIAIVAAPVLLFFGGIIRASGEVLKFFSGLVKVSSSVVSGVETLATKVGGLGNDVARTHPLWGTLGGDVASTSSKFIGLAGRAGALGLFTAGLVVATRVLNFDLPNAISQLLTGKPLSAHQNKNYKAGGVASATGSQSGTKLDSTGGKLFGIIPTNPLDWFGGMAEGGQVARKGAVWVGEKGPELLNLPAGATVSPLPRLAGTRFQGGVGDISGSMSQAITVDVNIPVYLDGRVIADSTARINRERANRR